MLPLSTGLIYLSDRITYMYLYDLYYIYRSDIMVFCPWYVCKNPIILLIFVLNLLLVFSLLDLPARGNHQSTGMYGDHYLRQE